MAVVARNFARVLAIVSLDLEPFNYFLRLTNYPRRMFHLWPSLLILSINKVHPCARKLYPHSSGYLNLHKYTITWSTAIMPVSQSLFGGLINQTATVTDTANQTVTWSTGAEPQGTVTNQRALREDGNPALTQRLKSVRKKREGLLFIIGADEKCRPYLETSTVRVWPTTLFRKG